MENTRSEAIEPRTRGLRAYTEALCPATVTETFGTRSSVLTLSHIRFYPATWCGVHSSKPGCPTDEVSPAVESDGCFSGVVVVAGGCGSPGTWFQQGGMGREAEPFTSRSADSSRREGSKLNSTRWVATSRCFCPPKLHFGKKWGGEDMSW